MPAQEPDHFTSRGHLPNTTAANAPQPRASQITMEQDISKKRYMRISPQSAVISD